MYRYTNFFDLSIGQLTEMHNRSFAGYFFPSEMTPEATAIFYRVNQIAPEHSVVMYDDSSTFIGIARVGLRGTRAWCGGFSIIPEVRGTGVGKHLVAQMIQAARQAGAITLQLEVLAQNTAAIKLYTGVGFVPSRRLVGVQIPSSQLLKPVQTLPAVSVPIDALLPLLAAQERPAWQRELTSLLSAKSQAVMLSSVQGLQAGLVFQQNGDRTQILAAHLPAETTLEALASLIAAAAGTTQTIQIYNEPEESRFLHLAQQLGFQEFFRQHEMFLTLT